MNPAMTSLNHTLCLQGDVLVLRGFDSESVDFTAV